MPMHPRRVLFGVTVIVMLGAATIGCGQTVNTAADGGPSSVTGTSVVTGPQGTTPGTRVPGSVPGSIPTSRPTTTTTTTRGPATTVKPGLTTSTTTPPTTDRSAELTELARHRAIWDATHPVAYRFKVRVGCFCPASIGGPFIITARGDTREIVNVDPAAGKVPLGNNTPPDIEGMFTKAKDALEKADKVDITYDEQYGFPTSVRIDWITEAVDDEMSLTISDFEVLG